MAVRSKIRIRGIRFSPVHFVSFSFLSPNVQAKGRGAFSASRLSALLEGMLWAICHIISNNAKQKGAIINHA